ncbi:MAG TPA: CHAT domain-containing protein [Ignavibacteriaceae bacterium]|nr:CHAT domain-containing protein [Ignavibacteriaceae bacterium]
MLNTAYAYAARLIIILIIFHSDSPAQEGKISSEKFSGLKTDSVKQSIINSGWNNSLCFEYQKFIINSKLDLPREMKFLEKLPSGVYKSFIKSLILKKQGKFKEMYEMLSELLEIKPQFYSFYNELAFSASAVNQFSPLELKIDRIYSHTEEDVFKNYLRALINLYKAKYKDALRYFQKSYKSDSLSPDIILQYSNAFRNAGDYEKAYELLRNGKEILKKDGWYLSGSLMAEGSLRFLSGDYKVAEELYKRAYEVSVKNSLKEPQAKILVNLGIMTDLKGNVNSARAKFNEAAALADEINDQEGKASAYSELGVSYSYTNDLINAKKNYLKSYEIYKLLGNKVRLSLLSQNLGKISLNIFNYKEALEFFQEGLNYAGENKRAQVLNLSGMADCYSNLSNYSKALEYYLNAKKIASEIKELALSAEVDYGLGMLNFSLDKFGSAIKYFQSAKKDADAAEDPFLAADICHKIGISYFKLDSLEKAEFFLNEGSRVAKKYSNPYTWTQCLIDLALLSFNKNDFNESEKFLSPAKSAALKNKFDYLYASSLLLEGKIAAGKNSFNEAQKKFKEALKIAEDLHEFNLIIESNYLLAKLFEKNNLDEAAESYYKSAVSSIEEVSAPLFSEQQIQISYFAGKKKIFEDYAEFLLNNKRYLEAFQLIDNSRSSNTMHNLNNIKLESIINDNTLLDMLYEAEWSVFSGIYDPAVIDSIGAKYKMLKENLIEKHPGIEKYLNLVKKYSVKEIQQGLSPGENLISIYSANKSTFIFRITQENFYPFLIPIGRDKISVMVSAISPYFGFNPGESKIFYNHDLFAFNVKAAFELYNSLIKPSIAGVPFDQKIIFSPSAELLPVPLEFLVTKYRSEGSDYDYSGKDYLIYNYNISYSPSAGVYIEQKNNMLKNNDKILIAGDPSLNNNRKGFNESRGILDDIPGTQRNFTLMPLKYSGEEINRISSIINADKVLSGSNATESNFKLNAEMSKLIHLSTHSFLFEKRPLIIFSDSYDRENDGFLEAGEIVKMKLNSDLVVLSSCNSGLGEIDPSEGILGMTKAFFEAGAKSVVVSLWDVNDKYTSKFMGLFYQRLNEGFDKSKALRLAKVDFIREYSSDPYYWGAFILSGNTSKISLKHANNIFPYAAGLMAVIAAIIFIGIKKKFSLFFFINRQK